jgi:hypothetical protein
MLLNSFGERLSLGGIPNIEGGGNNHEEILPNVLDHCRYAEDVNIIISSNIYYYDFKPRLIFAQTHFSVLDFKLFRNESSEEAKMQMFPI